MPDRRLKRMLLPQTHTETGKTSPLGDIRTEHFMRLTREEWENASENR